MASSSSMSFMAAAMYWFHFLPNMWVFSASEGLCKSAICQECTFGDTARRNSMGSNLKIRMYGWPLVYGHGVCVAAPEGLTQVLSVLGFSAENLRPGWAWALNVSAGESQSQSCNSRELQRPCRGDSDGGIKIRRPSCLLLKVLMDANMETGSS